MTVAAFQDAVHEYVAAGIVPLPVAPDGKRPLVRQPGTFGLRAALQIASKFPDANLGFWCGRRNGLTIVDVDSPNDSDLQFALDTFGDSPIVVRTASGKFHLYFQHNGERRHIRPIKDCAIDLLGEGGLCVAPPSALLNGRQYQFMRGGLADLAGLPTIRRKALESFELPRAEKSDSIQSAPIGTRNSSLFRLALALARDAASLDDLLDQTAQTNIKSTRPV